MLRAEQLALIQQANQQLLTIRELELDYYTTAFSNLGTICSFIAGFSINALTSLAPMQYNCAEFWRTLYAICLITCISSALHCSLSTSFAGIFGSGLALRGPSGSMVRAVDGLIAEKEQIYASFVLTIISFQGTAFCISWIVMSNTAASVCSAVFIISSYIWYKYCTRIHIRFRIPKEHRDLDFSRSADDDNAPDENDLHGESLSKE